LFTIYLQVNKTCYWRYKEHTDLATFQQQKNVRIPCRSDWAPPIERRGCVHKYLFHIDKVSN